MNQLVSMLVPLETLPGWPPAPAPSLLGSLAIFVGFPALVGVIVVAIAKLRRPRAGSTPAGEPLWLRGEDPAARGSVEGVRAIEARQAVEGATEASERGGASARW